MLELVIPECKLWDDNNAQFIKCPGGTIKLEHSLVSLAKWESKWHKPFLTDGQDVKTNEEMLDYIRCMTITQNVNPLIYYGLKDEHYLQIKNYIDNPMSATKLPKSNSAGNKVRGEQITSDLIYCWMVLLQIPPEYQKWHLRRLIILIELCADKNQDPTKKKKKSQKEIMDEHRAINKAHRAKYESMKKGNTNGI